MQNYIDKATGSPEGTTPSLTVEYAWDDHFLTVGARPAAPGGGLPTGFGLLLAGGYLTQKGGEVLSCPSRQLPQRIDDHWLAYSGNYAKLAWPMLNDMVRWDANEPFFTTGGKAGWADGDYIGECGAQGPINGSPGFSLAWWPEEVTATAPATPVVDPATGVWGRQIYGIGGLAVRGCTDSTTSGERLRTSYCMIVGAYQVRPDVVTGWTWNSYKLDEIQGQAVGSDAIYGFWMRNYRGPQVISSGGSWGNIEYNDLNELQYAYWTSNHDAAYNVLFTDGSVKTFSDGGMSLFKEAQKLQIANLGDGLSLRQLGQVFALYFDNLYAQD
ncbi:MAG: hypothetical protein V2A58_08700 [Planctomycetota bacterium]